jgi:glucokinase
VTKSIGVILAGEIGPSETRLALCGLDVGRPVVVIEESAPNRGSSGLAPIVQRFLAKYRPPLIRAASFVVAGPVHDGVCLAANLPWPIESNAVASELGIEKVTVLSDVEAIAHALQTLAQDDLLALSRGDALDYGNQVVLSVGQYPGISGLYWNGSDHRSFVSEGGRADFAPSSEEELRLALHLSGQVARVTVELMLSSVGLDLIYRYLRSGAKGEPLAPARATRHEEGADAIVRAAMAGTDATCRKALDTFLSIYGSTAGNLALTLGATGGVYLAGDIVPGLRVPLTNGVFQSAFWSKGTAQALLCKIPIYAILNERAALLGAATVAARDLRARIGNGWAS